MAEIWELADQGCSSVLDKHNGLMGERGDQQGGADNEGFS
uniref:Uncharacterized protein n=1 Tax=Anguilla anguilla TaxID=7936 RepID=A0A0E9PU51_ANGAN